MDASSEPATSSRARPLVALLALAPLVFVLPACGDAGSGAGPGAGPDARTRSDGAAGTDARVLVPPADLEVRFAVPTPDGDHRDVTLEETLRELLDLTPAGAEVRVALYHWTRGGMADAFVAASARGVDVRLVLDGSNVEYAALARLRAGLGAERVTVCEARGACIGDGINHNKFFLFSRLDDGSTDVVVQSSANLTASQLAEHNNMVIIRNDAALHAGYRAYWDDLRAQVPNLGYYRSVDGDLPVKAYFFPRQGGDTIVSVLDNITSCADTRIRVAMAFFTDGRTAVADALAARARQGCDVRVVVRDDAEIGSPGTDVLATLLGAGVGVDVYPGIDTGESLHSKILLIDGLYLGAPARLLWTGSHNYTGPALTRNDESLLKLDDGPVFDAFWANWELIQERAIAAR